MSTIALLAWPFVTLILVLRLPFPKAVVISVLGGFLLLPPTVGINLPLLPIFNKNTIPALTLLALAVLMYGARQPEGGVRDQPGMAALPRWLPRSRVGIVCLLMIVVGAVMTAATNKDTLIYGSTSLPALQLYDGFSLALSGLTLAVPLLLGRKFLAHPESHVFLLRSLIVGGLAYSLLVLYEVRMSPQLSNMVYGFFPHSWVQHIRSGGWRPVVFMEHGLQLAIFLAATTLATFAASRCLETQRRGFYLLGGIWLLGTLVLSNSLGALLITLAFLPAILFLGPRLQMLFAGCIAVTVVLYPMLRSVDVIPTERLVSMAESIDARRAGSLQYRFDNEDALLEHARERPLFGWGGWRRNRVFNETGQDISTTDGAWVIVMGIRGWVGYLAQFGLLTAPLLLVSIRWRQYEVSSVTIFLALVLSALLVDLIPNGFLSPVTLLIAGALWGRLELGAAVQDTQQTADEEMPHGHLAHARPRAAARQSGASGELSAGKAQETLAYTRQTVRHKRSGN